MSVRGLPGFYMILLKVEAVMITDFGCMNSDHYTRESALRSL